MDARQLISQALAAFERDPEYLVRIAESVAHKIEPPPAPNAPRHRPRRSRPARPRPQPVAYDFPVTVRYVEPTAPPLPKQDATAEEWRERKSQAARNREAYARQKAAMTQADIDARRARDRARYWAKRDGVPSARELERRRRAAMTPEEREADAKAKRRARYQERNAQNRAEAQTARDRWYSQQDPS